MNRYDPDPNYYNTRGDPNSSTYRGNGYDNRDPEYYYKMKGTTSSGGGYNEGMNDLLRARFFSKTTL